MHLRGLQIFSYLHPSSLQVCVKLSKTFRGILCSKTLLPVWRAAFEPPAPQFKQPLLQFVPKKPGPLPQLEGADVDLVKLAAALFDTHCQVRETWDGPGPKKGAQLSGRNSQYCDESVDRGDRYLLIALCVDCRTANLVSQADVGKGKEWQDLHPATLQALLGTYRKSKPFISAYQPSKLTFGALQSSRTTPSGPAASAGTCAPRFTQRPRHSSQSRSKTTSKQTSRSRVAPSRWVTCTKS